MIITLYIYEHILIRKYVSLKIVSIGGYCTGCALNIFVDKLIRKRLLISSGRSMLYSTLKIRVNILN